MLTFLTYLSIYCFRETGDTKGVQNVQVNPMLCPEGRLLWKYTTGGLEITFKLDEGTDSVEICFRATSYEPDPAFYFGFIKRHHHSKFISKLNINKTKLPIKNAKIDHGCLTSFGNDSITLYIDVKADINSTTVGYVKIFYDITKKLKMNISEGKMTMCNNNLSLEVLVLANFWIK